MKLTMRVLSILIPALLLFACTASEDDPPLECVGVPTPDDLRATADCNAVQAAYTALVGNKTCRVGLPDCVVAADLCTISGGTECYTLVNTCVTPEHFQALEEVFTNLACPSLGTPECTGCMNDLPDPPDVTCSEALQCVQPSQTSSN